jgi:hypothetical protein|tara:strand:+ start:6382 stop:6885 length:504 start_codon:yes stop_codon:yes gene_type:complete
MSNFQKWFIDQFQFAGWLPLETSDLTKGATLAWNQQQEKIDELETKLTDMIKDRIATIDVVRENYELKERLSRLETAVRRTDDSVCQTLGKVLGYPWYKDDLEVFPVFPYATECMGVCVGDHVAESIAMDAAKHIVELESKLALERKYVHNIKKRNAELLSQSLGEL